VTALRPAPCAFRGERVNLWHVRLLARLGLTADSDACSQIKLGLDALEPQEREVLRLGYLERQKIHGANREIEERALRKLKVEIRRCRGMTEGEIVRPGAT